MCAIDVVLQVRLAVSSALEPVPVLCQRCPALIPVAVVPDARCCPESQREACLLFYFLFLTETNRSFILGKILSLDAHAESEGRAVKSAQFREQTNPTVKLRSQARSASAPADFISNAVLECVVGF